MWVLGLMIGAIVGSLWGGGGTIFGAVLGLIAGVAIRQGQRSATDKAWKRDVEERLQRLQRRVRALEQGPDVAPAASVVTAVDVPEVAEQTASVVMPSNISVPPVAEPAAPVDSAPVQAGPVREAARPSPAVPPSDTLSNNPFTRWLFGGNTLVRVGVIVLFFGVAFLLKFMADRDLVPVELRLASVALGGTAMLGIGWRMRAKRPEYALMLQGGGVGILYLTVFAALRLYAMLSPELAFGLLAGIATFSAILAVKQDSRSLAVTGVTGGFLAPILASTGSGNHVILFSYYAVLNAGIVGIAFYKAWREFNLIGFVFTFLIGLGWGAKYYRPELFASVEPFLVLFFFFYVALAVLFASREGPRLTHYVDGTIVFGTPLVAFGLQTALVRNMEFGAAWSAFAVAAFYIVLASLLYVRRRETLRLLVESFLALGIGFATLAVPLAFDGRWTSAVWAVEGAAAVWVGTRQRRVLPRIFGLLLQPAAGFALLKSIELGNVLDVTPVLNSLYLGCVMVSVAGLFCSRYLEYRRESVGELELLAARLLFVWGALWWFAGGLAEISRHAPVAWGWHPHLLFLTGTCAAFGWLWRKLDWGMARYASLALLPMVAVLLFAGFIDRPDVPRHPFANHAYLGWSLVFGVHLWLLRLHEGRDEEWLDGLHAAGFWLLAVIVSWEVGWQIDRYVDGNMVWPFIAWALVPSVLIAVLAARGGRMGWPVATHRGAYLYAGALPLAVFLLGWMIYVNFRSDGNPAPLPYVPLLNPLDLAQAGVLLASITWYVGVRRLALPGAKLPDPTTGTRLLGTVLFVALNGVLVRTLHHYADVPFNIYAMWHSNLTQASFSLFWSLIALAAMVVATRRRLRALWMVGAGLLAVVVAKLFLVDLANTGTVERVVSFVGVGILVIVIGYFSPVPPRSQEHSA